MLVNIEIKLYTVNRTRKQRNTQTKMELSNRLLSRFRFNLCTVLQTKESSANKKCMQGIMKRIIINNFARQYEANFANHVFLIFRMHVIRKYSIKWDMDQAILRKSIRKHTHNRSIALQIEQGLLSSHWQSELSDIQGHITRQKKPQMSICTFWNDQELTILQHCRSDIRKYRQEGVRTIFKRAHI